MTATALDNLAGVRPLLVISTGVERSGREPAVSGACVEVQRPAGKPFRPEGRFANAATYNAQPDVSTPLRSSENTLAGPGWQRQASACRWSWAHPPSAKPAALPLPPGYFRPRQVDRRSMKGSARHDKSECTL